MYPEAIVTPMKAELTTAGFTELLNPEDYKHWKDTIYAFGGADNYISYLVELKKL